MEKQELLKEYKNQDDKILLSFILDKIKFVTTKNKIENTNFLNMQQIDLVEVGSNGKVRYVVDGRDLDTMTEAQVMENLEHATNLLDGSAQRGAKEFGITVEDASQRGADVVVITDNKKTQVEFSTMDSVHRGDPGATKMVTAAYSARAGENEEIVLMQPNAYAGSTGILSTDEYFIMTSEHEGVSIGGHANSNTNSTTQRVTGNHDWDRAQAFEESMTQRNAIRKTFGTELRLTRSEAKVGYQPGTNGLMALVESVDDAGGNATQWIDDYKLYCKTDKRKAYVAFYDLAGFVNAHSTGINTGGKTVMEYFLDQNEILY